MTTPLSRRRTFRIFAKIKIKLPLL